MWVTGIHAVTMALANQRVTELVYVEHKPNPRIQELIDACGAEQIPVNRVTKQVIEQRVAHATHQGIAASVSGELLLNETHLKTWMLGCEHEMLLLILDGVQDPHNLGACLRVADGAGVDAVIIPKDKAVSITDTVHKVSCGASLSVPVVSVTNLARVMKWLKEQNVWIYGTSDKATRDYFECDNQGNVAWVLGNEQKGLRRLTSELCDELYRIPMQGEVSSLNVSVACGVVLFESARQRRHR